MSSDSSELESKAYPLPFIDRQFSDDDSRAGRYMQRLAYGDLPCRPVFSFWEQE